MNIAIIGAGKVGRALGGSLLTAGHGVTYASATPAAARSLAQSLPGARAAGSNVEAVSGATLVILAVPYAAVNEVLTELQGHLRGKILVDVTNPLNEDYSDLVTGAVSGAELIQARVREAPVIKAFNTILAALPADPYANGMQLDGFVAGEDGDAKAQALELVCSIGFNPIDAGSLAMARALEALALLNLSLQQRNGWPREPGWKTLGPTRRPTTTNGGGRAGG